MNEVLQKILYGVAILLILFGVYHFCLDLYVVLYRLYYDSNYFTRFKNTIELFLAKWSPL